MNVSNRAIVGISCGLLLLTQFSLVMAFEVNGFRSHMGQEEALGVLRGRVERVAPIQGTGERKTAFLGTNTGTGETESIIFCDGRLTSYSFDIRGGLQSFIRVVERESSVLGQGRYESSSQETPVGTWTTLKFSWRIGTDTKEVSISQVANQREQVSVSYVVPSQRACDLRLDR